LIGRFARIAAAGVCAIAVGLGCGDDDEPGPSEPRSGSAGTAGAPTNAGGAGSTLVQPLVDCSINRQDCAGEELKCTVIQEGTFRPACAQNGTRALGETCERIAVGDDNCVRGTWCTPLNEAAAAPRTQRCRTLCNANDQCDAGAGERCYQYSLGQLNVFGACMPACRPFETPCAEGLHCLPVADASSARFFICSPYGALAEGEACATAESCGQGLSCAQPERRCRHYCDAENPCLFEGQTCTSLNQADQPGLGVCVP
jgi:hypothetical protein